MGEKVKDSYSPPVEKIHLVSRWCRECPLSRIYYSVVLRVWPILVCWIAFRRLFSIQSECGFEWWANRTFEIKRYSHHPKCHLRLLRTKNLYICFSQIDVIVFFFFCTLFVLQIPLCWSACAWVLVRTIFSHVLIFSQISFIADVRAHRNYNESTLTSLSSASQSKWNSNGK